MVILSQQGSARAPHKRDLEVKPWRYVVGLPWQKLSQISPKTSVYIGGGEGPCLGAQGAPRGSAEARGRVLPPGSADSLGIPWTPRQGPPPSSYIYGAFRADLRRLSHGCPTTYLHSFSSRSRFCGARAEPCQDQITTNLRSAVTLPENSSTSRSLLLDQEGRDYRRVVRVLNVEVPSVRQ